jgi:hypothetical protein
MSVPSSNVTIAATVFLPHGRHWPPVLSVGGRLRSGDSALRGASFDVVDVVVDRSGDIARDGDNAL